MRSITQRTISRRGLCFIPSHPDVVVSTRLPLVKDLFRFWDASTDYMPQFEEAFEEPEREMMFNLGSQA
jgi:hypothetical protein